MDKIFEAEFGGMKFRIEEDFPEVGVYLYIYKNEKCIRDELQDTIDICKKIALENYGVPISEWREIKK